MERVQDRRGVLGLFRRGIAVLRLVRPALPAEVGGVDPEAGQQGYQAVKAAAGFAPRVQQQYRLRACVALDEARHGDAGAEPEIPDFGFHRVRLRRSGYPDRGIAVMLVRFRARPTEGALRKTGTR